MMREALINRKTKETEIKLELNLMNTVKATSTRELDSLTICSRFLLLGAGIKLNVDCKGDLEIDGHHTVEDIGICLGQAIKKAIGDKKGINRYGSSRIPMDGSLALVDLSISNRSFLVFNVEMPSTRAGEFETELTEEFFLAVAHNSGITMHINLEYGRNTHHINEAIFVALCTIFDDNLQRQQEISHESGTRDISYFFAVFIK